VIPTNWLTHRARTRPDATAVRDRSGRSLTFRELLARAAPAAEGLRRPDGLCVIELEPGIEHAVAINAAMLAGVPFQTLRPGLPEAERTAALAGAAHFALDPGLLEPGSGREVTTKPGPDPGDALCRILTSGTSGGRRPVALTWANHFCSASASAFRLGVRTEDRWLCCMPVDHVGGLSILIRSLIYGTTAIVHPDFDTDAVAAAIAGDVTIVSLVATQLGRLLACGAPVERPRLLLLGGGPVPGDVLDEALARGANVVQTYGLTEACSQVCTLSVAEASERRGSAGRPLDGTVVEVEAGEIVVGGPTVAPGAVNADGWLRTGDRGRLDADGFLWVEGRLDDLIITGGENVAPEEVEAVLAAHPGVAEAAVFGRPDARWGEAVCAAVVPARGAPASGAEALAEHCRRSLARHKVPKSIEIVSELPRTATGKLLRRELR
jgi:O-succinylbenzoic acid--CoA ligase